MNILTIPRRTTGTPTFNAEENNTLLLAVKSLLNGRRTEIGAGGASTQDAITEFQWINVKFNEEVPAWSIFPVQYTDRGFFYGLPLVHADEDLDPSQLDKREGIIYVTNGGVKANQSDLLQCWIIGHSRPHRIRYIANTDGIPSLGKKVKPHKEFNGIELHRNGQFVAVSAADTDQETIWIVRKDTLYTPTPWVRTILDPDSGY